MKRINVRLAVLMAAIMMTMMCFAKTQDFGGRVGDIPEGMQLFPIQSGKWLKIHFEGGMKAFQEQNTKFHKEWLPAHPEYKWAPNSCSMEWYQGTDIESPDYQCGVMMPLEN